MSQEITAPNGMKLTLGKRLSPEKQAELSKILGTPPSPPPPSKKEKVDSEEKHNHTVKKRREPKPLTHDQQQTATRRLKIKEAINWLCAYFPQGFSTENPKPLKLRIEADIFSLLPEEEAPTKTAIRNALAYYTKSPLYLEAIATNDKRFDVQGLPVEDTVDEIHKTTALEMLQKRKAANEVRKEAAKEKRRLWKERREKRQMAGKTSEISQTESQID